MELHSKENGHVNAGMEMEEDCSSSTSQSNNNRKIKLEFDHSKKESHKHPGVVFEDLPYEPSAIMDKIEKFWITLAAFFSTHQRIFKIVGLAVIAFLYNCYFFGAVAYFIQYKVNKNYVTTLTHTCFVAGSHHDTQWSFAPSPNPHTVGYFIKHLFDVDCI